MLMVFMLAGLILYNTNSLEIVSFIVGLIIPFIILFIFSDKNHERRIAELEKLVLDKKND